MCYKVNTFGGMWTGLTGSLTENRSKKMLAETKLPISEIAFQTGYAKQGKLAEVFRQHFQMNPLEYRRSKHRKCLFSHLYFKLTCLSKIINELFPFNSPIFSIPFLSHNSLSIFPISVFNFPYITCLRNLDANTM